VRDDDSRSHSEDSDLLVAELNLALRVLSDLSALFDP